MSFWPHHSTILNETFIIGFIIGEENKPKDELSYIVDFFLFLLFGGGGSIFLLNFQKTVSLPHWTSHSYGGIPELISYSYGNKVP